MPRFSDRALARVRRNVEAMLTDTCSIERETYSKGTMGEPLHTFEVVAEDVPCRVLQAGQGYGSNYAEVGGQEALRELTRVVLRRDAEFVVNDRIVMADGRTYLVIDAEDALTDSAFVDAVCTRVRV
jgi:hypothetical protein